MGAIKYWRSMGRWNMRQLNELTQTVPLGMVGGCSFGRYPKISLEETFNFIISDNFLVNFAGYRNILSINASGEGRAAYSSTRYNAIIAVIDSSVYAITPTLSPNGTYIANTSFIGNIETSTGDVFIAENNANQIGICDKLNIYIFDYSANTFTTLTPSQLGFAPGHISFQDGYFIATQTDFPLWRLSAPNNGLSWPPGANNTGEFQTEADKIVATMRMPGKGNLLYVFGQNVIEQWVDTGLNLFPYQKTTYTNIDYGCINAATIAANDTIVVWLASNGKSGPVIMFSDGGDPVTISTDGIDFKLANLVNPELSYSNLFKQDGHLIYQITFYGNLDNYSLIYDFTSKKFSFVTDNKRNAHIARKVVYFKNAYFFVARNDGNFYQFSSNFYDGNGEDIPKIRTTRNFRLPDANRFIGQNVNFTMEQGEGIVSSLSSNGQIISEAAQQVLHFCMSKNGGQDFSNIYERNLNPLGVRPNRVNYWNLGSGNDFIFQFTFWGHGRYVVGEGEFNFYQ